MHRRQRTFAELLTRSLATAGLLYALFFAYAVPAALVEGRAEPPGHAGPGASSPTEGTSGPNWKPAHAVRFPGCVDMARWSASQVPRTVVVLDRDDRVKLMPFDEAYRRAKSGSAADDVRTIGACG